MVNKRLKLLLSSHIFILLAGCLPFFLVAPLLPCKIDFEPVLAWFVVLISSMRISMSVNDKGHRIIDITFWIYVYVFLGISPMLQLTSRNMPWGGTYSDDIIIASFVLIYIGIFSYQIGTFFSKLKFSFFFDFINKLCVFRDIDPNKTVLLNFIALAISMIIIFWLGDLKILFLPRHFQTITLMELLEGPSLAKFLIFSTLLRVPIFIGLILLWALWSNNNRSIQHNFKFDIRYKILFFLLLFANLLINNPINSARYWFGTIALSLFFVSFRWLRNGSLAICGTAIVLGMIFVFPFADLFRHTTNPDISIEFSTHRISKELVENGDYDSFQQILNTIEHVQYYGLTHGKQILGTIMFWVPRSLWKNKPVASGILVAESAGYDYTNLSLPLWAEAYLDGGLIGAIFVFMAYGFIIGLVERVYSTNRFLYQATFLDVLIPLYAAYQIFLLRGTLMSAIAYFMPIILILFASTKTSVWKHSVMGRATY